MTKNPAAPRTARSMVGAAAITVVLAACMPGEPRIEGAVTVGASTLPFTSCRSGDARSYFGVELATADGRALRLVDDPVLGVVGRYMPAGVGEPGIVLDGKVCRTLRAAIEPTGWRVNKVRVLRGSAFLDCTLTDGTLLRGELRFEDCL